MRAPRNGINRKRIETTFGAGNGKHTKINRGRDEEIRVKAEQLKINKPSEVLSSNISDGLWLKLHSGNTQAEKHCLSGKSPQRDFEQLKKTCFPYFSSPNKFVLLRLSI